LTWLNGIIGNISAVIEYIIRYLALYIGYCYIKDIIIFSIEYTINKCLELWHLLKIYHTRKINKAFIGALMII
jgi:hypothetical protein